MKKKLKIVVSVVGIIILLLICGILWIAKNGVDISTGTCLIADNGRYMIIIDNSPIAMSIRSGDGTLFDGLETGDEILIVHDGIAESYPGRTGVYFCMKLNKGNEIPGEVVMELIDLGWITAETKEEVLREPPDLAISSGGEKVTALKGTYSWNYQNPDGTYIGMEADSVHPLENKEYMPQLLIASGEDSDVNPLYAVLQFEAAPDEVIIRYWTEDCWNDVYAESQVIEVRPAKVTLENGSKSIMQFNIELQEESGIYEVAAKWNSFENYNGTASYSFYTTVQVPE